MMKLFTIAFLALGCAVVTRAAVMVEEPDLPREWIEWGTPREDETFHVMLKIKGQNTSLLEETVLEVSDPTSERYTQYLTRSEVLALTAPLSKDLATVTNWLKDSNCEIDAGQGVATCPLTVASVEQLFNTTVREVRHSQTLQKALRACCYHLPEEITNAVSAVFGMHGLPIPHDIVAAPPAIKAPPNVTPPVLLSYYGISGVDTSSGHASQAVAEFQGQLMNESDLVEFFDMFLPDAPAKDAKVNKFHGTLKDGEGVEAQLDIQYMMGVSAGVKTDFYEQMNMDFCADLKNWTTLLLSDDNTPLVHSVSYGWQGNLSRIGCKADELSVVDDDFKKLAAMGISMMISSGDSGSGYAPPMPPPSNCPNDGGTDGKEYQGTIIENLEVPSVEARRIACEICQQRETCKAWTAFPMANPKMMQVSLFADVKGTGSKDGAISAMKLPEPPSPTPKTIDLYASWPASSPWVTSVGATRFYKDDVKSGVEAAVGEEDHFGSGGGFFTSSMFPQPAWQKHAVSKYFATVDKSTLPPSSAYDRHGRGTPDVGALGTGYWLINGGHNLFGVGGTSASSPVFAGIVSLLNEARMSAGKKPLGFLNQFIYQNMDAFKDVSIGSDKIGRGGSRLPYGFNCSSGWDPVVGVGTPIFSKLLAAAMKAK